MVGLTSRSLLELAIGIERGFIASGISRPFCGLAPSTFTCELEATLEGQRGDALIEHVGGLFLGAGLLLIPFPYQIDFAMYGNDVMDLTSAGLRSM